MSLREDSFLCIIIFLYAMHFSFSSYFQVFCLVFDFQLADGDVPSCGTFELGY